MRTSSLLMMRTSSRDEALDDRRRRLRRRQHRLPGDRLEAGVALLDQRRELRQRGGASERGHAQAAQLAGAHLAHRDARHHEAGLHLAGEDGVDHLREALVGHVHEVDAGAALEQLHRQVRRAAVAHAAVVELALLRLGDAHEVGQRVGAELRVDHQQVRRGGHQRDRRELLDRVVAAGDLLSSGAVTSGPWMVNSSVWPSGSALATRPVPRLPPAPGLLSTTTGWPSAAASGSATRRAMRSGELPGGNGTTSLIGRDGQACASDRQRQRGGGRGGGAENQSALHRRNVPLVNVRAAPRGPSAARAPAPA